ncbi:MAG TPA: hypothetical protein VMH02_05360 [Verrucomicrobiae bacterium]|nr:hypothetical protein [Verrucomicrobiae bacterium]
MAISVLAFLVAMLGFGAHGGAVAPAAHGGTHHPVAPIVAPAPGDTGGMVPIAS